MRPGQNKNRTSISLWQQALKAPKKTAYSRRKTKKSEVIHYPEFFQASKIVDDPYWRDTLKKCAQRKFPRGFIYSDGQLTHRNNNVSILLPDDLEALTKTVIYFFQENGKLYSKKDIKRRKKKEEEQYIRELKEKSEDWGKVSISKNRRSTHVKDYVKEKYKHLSKDIQNAIFTQINIGFETKYITKAHVTFENGKVTNIDGVDGDENGVIFTREDNRRLTPIKYKDNNNNVNKIYNYKENWHKCLDLFQKDINNVSSSSYVIQTSEYT
jgi:hypothetical protein